jgi:uncharacterized membrane protein YedE/YeeE
MTRTYLFGMLFGFILSRAGATDFDAIIEMFALKDGHIVGTMGVAVLIAGLGLWWMRRRGVACPQGCHITAKRKARKPGNVVGGVIFGAGWALTGTCPGTSLAQLGEGRVMALFTIIGIVLGTALYRHSGEVVEAWLKRRSPQRRTAEATA